MFEYSLGLKWGQGFVRDVLAKDLENIVVIDLIHPAPQCAREIYRRQSAFCSAAFHNLPVRIGLCYLAAMKAKSVVVVDPEIMSGTPCFAGTRVPARTLIDHLEAGDSLDVFLEDFPTVTRKQAIAFLEEASERMLAVA